MDARQIFQIFEAYGDFLLYRDPQLSSAVYIEFSHCEAELEDIAEAIFQRTDLQIV